MSRSSSSHLTSGDGSRLIYSLLSAIVPGAGQMLAGNWRRGVLMFGMTLLLIACGVAVYLQGLSTLLSSLVQPRVLIGVFVVNLLVLLFRIGSVLDAYLSPRSRQGQEPRGWRGAIVAIVLAIVLTATAAPHAVLGYYTYLTHDTLNTVFSSDALSDTQPSPSPAPVPTATPEPTATPQPTATPMPTPEPGETPLPTATPEPSPTPAPSPTPEATAVPELAFESADWMDRGRLTVLLAGSDQAPDRSGARTDVMMVATLDLESGQVTLFGVPRNYGDIPLPENIAGVMGTDEYPGMLKWLYGEAQQYPELAPEGGDPGLVALKGAIGELLGLQIDYYAMVNMQGFVRVVDALGGVQINPEERVHVRLLSPIEGEGWEAFDIQPGEQVLNGKEALAYARSRSGNSDYDRMARQRCLVTAVASQGDLPTLAPIFPELLDVVRQNVVTDIPLEMLPDMVTLRDVARIDQVISIGFVPPRYLAGRSSQGFNLPAYQAILETVQDALNNPDSYLEQQDRSSLAFGGPCQ